MEVHEEVTCLSDDGSTRRKKTAFIVDSTIRFETDENEDKVVDEEKRLIYEPTIPYFLEKYNVNQIDVI